VAAPPTDTLFLCLASLFLVALSFWPIVLLCRWILPKTPSWAGLASAASALAAFVATNWWLGMVNYGMRGPSNFEDMWFPLALASTTWAIAARVVLAFTQSGLSGRP